MEYTNTNTDEPTIELGCGDGVKCNSDEHGDGRGSVQFWEVKSC